MSLPDGSFCLYVPVPVPVPVPEERSMQFDHERLDVNRLALAFIVVANDVAQALPRGRSYIADQIQRAATSVVLNLAEGAGEYGPNDKARFYRMSKRSATECSAVLDVCKELNIVAPERYAVGREQLLRIVSMLVRLAQSASGTGTGTGTGT